jgi:hypothetical protein
VFLPLSVKAVAFSGGWLLCSSCDFDCVWIIACEVSIVHESSDQNTRIFLVRIALSQWFFEHARKVFGKICKRA